MKYPDLFILLGHSMLFCMHVGFMSILMDGMNTSVRCSAQVVWNVLRVYDVYLSPVLLGGGGLSSSYCVRLCLWSSYILTFWTHSWGERPKRACWRVGNFATSLEIGQSCEHNTLQSHIRFRIWTSNQGKSKHGSEIASQPVMSVI